MSQAQLKVLETKLAFVLLELIYLNSDLCVEICPAPLHTFQASEMTLHCNFHPPQ